MALLVISMLSRFLIAIAFNAVYQLTHEIFPTELRAQGVAMSRSLGHAFKIFSSYVAFSVSCSVFM
jgi:hypothetical protein